ncbi:hypothetical protein CLV55_103135 [Flavobacterium aciduliphilum]|uniref:TIR domain-containing protein n=1 Tax=Flavobacterium aciduliphilum TaxID=1101402 RepID=A0A328YUT4_9FLAO|nr:hypothetical protein CLV55_103135 [Flavobacterium aciduliphilum]
MEIFLSHNDYDNHQKEQLKSFIESLNDNSIVKDRNFFQNK